MVFEVGRICIKTAGRDAGLKCIIVDVLDNNFVLIDGQTRRRKCNTNHLEALSETIKLKKNASRKDVVAEFKKLKIELKETKPKKAGVKPVRLKKKKVAVVKETTSAKTPEKKDSKLVEKKEVSKKPVKTTQKKK